MVSGINTEGVQQLTELANTTRNQRAARNAGSGGNNTQESGLADRDDGDGVVLDLSSRNDPNGRVADEVTRGTSGGAFASGGIPVEEPIPDGGDNPDSPPVDGGDEELPPVDGG